MAGQKVEKVFNHEEKDYGKFCEMNENFRKESTNAGICWNDDSYNSKSFLS